MDSRLYHQIAAIRAAEDRAYAAAVRTIRAGRGQGRSTRTAARVPTRIAARISHR